VVVAGLGLAAPTVLLAESLPAPLARDVHALVLTVVAGPDAGFASMDGRPRALATEAGGIVVCCGLAVLGSWVRPPVLAVGHAGHAVRDGLGHPDGRFGATLVGWDVPFCVVCDLAVAGYLVVVLFG
jgi:hypothetical protein